MKKTQGWLEKNTGRRWKCEAREGCWGWGCCCGNWDCWKWGCWKCCCWNSCPAEFPGVGTTVHFPPPYCCSIYRDCEERERERERGNFWMEKKSRRPRCKGLFASSEISQTLRDFSEYLNRSIKFCANLKAPIILAPYIPPNRNRTRRSCKNWDISEHTHP